MTLYSHNGAAPALLPFRIRVPDGNGTRSRTDPSTFTAGEIEAAGYVAADAAPAPVGGVPARWHDGAWRSAPEYDPATEHPPVWSGIAWGDPVARSLAELKAAAIAAVKNIGPTRVAEGFKYTVPGSGVEHTYQVDLESQSHMVAVYVEHLDGKTSPHGGYWRSRANVNVDMTDAENKAFLEGAKAYKMAIIRRAQALIDAIVAAEDATELATVDPVAGTIDGNGGWPVNGG